MFNLAVIPARAGSTRLLNKNIYPLGGKPLIRWITESVVNSKLFDMVFISTDSDDIFDTVKDLNVTRHYREKDEATKEATVLEAMMNIAYVTKNNFNTFSYFLPTCPFVSCEDIINGMSLLKSSDFVVSMTQFTETIQLACQMVDDTVVPVFDNLEQGITNSQLIKKYYKPSGAFYMANMDKLIKHKNFFKGKTKGIVLPRERSVDINDINDIKYAESLMKLKT